MDDTGSDHARAIVCRGSRNNQRDQRKKREDEYYADGNVPDGGWIVKPVVSQGQEDTADYQRLERESIHLERDGHDHSVLRKRSRAKEYGGCARAATQVVGEVAHAAMNAIDQKNEDNYKSEERREQFRRVARRETGGETWYDRRPEQDNGAPTHSLPQVS